MAQTLLNSSVVEVFPAARRGITKPKSRLMSEEAFASIINRFVEYDSFLVKFGETDSGTVALDEAIAFNIHGYYFKVNKANDLLTNITGSGTVLYASIELVTIGDYTEIWGQDVDNQYQGLVLSLEKPGEVGPHGGKVYTLPLLQRPASVTTHDKWAIYPSSVFRFTSRSVNFEIDGGEIK